MKRSLTFTAVERRRISEALQIRRNHAEAQARERRAYSADGKLTRRCTVSEMFLEEAEFALAAWRNAERQAIERADRRKRKKP